MLYKSPKDRYFESDFETKFARDFFQVAKGVTNFDLLEQYADQEARDALKALMDDMAARMTSIGSALPDDVTSWDMGKGRIATRDEIMDLVLSEGNKRVLDSHYVFETVFRQNQTAEEILLMLQNKRQCSLREEFSLFARIFPAEATFIRVQMKHPEMKQHRAIYDFVMKNTEDNLDRPVLLPVTGRLNSFPPLGSASGPRMPALSEYDIGNLLNFWAGSDQALTPILMELKREIEKSATAGGILLPGLGGGNWKP